MQRWDRLDLSEVLEKLTTAKALLEQAAALAAAREAEKVRVMTELQQRSKTESQSGRRRQHR